MVRRKKVDRIIGIGRDLKEYESVFDIQKEFYLTTEELYNLRLFARLKTN